MWPFRPEKLSDALDPDEIRVLLGLGDSLGSAVTLVETLPDGSFVTIDPDGSAEERRADPFCSYFRHGRSGARRAFAGADAACARCEQKFARRLLAPGNAGTLSPADTGVVRLRCHMGLTDYQAPVVVAGKVVAGLIAGRRVESDDDRQRIRKIVGKLGKLTRAEAEKTDANGRLIEPETEKAREQLIQEIPAIPLRSPEFEVKLVELGQILGRLAARQFESVRRVREDTLVERIDSPGETAPRSFGDLRRESGALLETIKAELEVEYLAFFAATPKEIDSSGSRVSLIAESGIGTSTARRVLELDWSKVPSLPTGGGGEVSRGKEAVSATSNAIHTTRDTPEGLKDRLTKCFFLVPVELGSGLRAALAFGPASSEVRPDDRDYELLVRLARAVSRRYYVLAGELERTRLADQLASEGSARKEAEAGRKELEKTEGFTFFDARKLLNQCLERVGPQAQKRGVELDTRELLERLHFRGDRQEIANVISRLLTEGVERTLVDPESSTSSPVRVFLKRSRTRLFFGVESIGELLQPKERRILFSREVKKARGSKEAVATHGQGARAAVSPDEERQPRPLANEVTILRRHDGRLRVDSERLRRWERNPNRWVGKTTFFVDLPLPTKG